MKKNLVTTFLAALTFLTSHAYTVKVRATDPNGQPEEYATCRVFAPQDTIHPVVAGITDTLGVWSADIKKAGTYTLRLEVVGNPTIAKQFTLDDKNPVADLGTIATAANELNEIVVTAQRPIVTKQIDRIGYDVKADQTAQTLTIREVLRRVPMVNVDGQGNITINGSSNFKVFKNGRPNNSLTKNAKEIFDALPASSIKRIEVITEPGAKYDAEGIGAILNIVTDDETVIKGVTGRVGLDYDVVNNGVSGNLWLSSQIDKVTFSVNGGVNRIPSKMQTNDQYEDYTYENGTHSVRTQHQTGSGTIGWFDGEASWEIDSLNLISGEFGGYAYGISGDGYGTQSLTAADGTVLSSYKSSFTFPTSSYFDIDGNLNYQRLTRRKGEAITFSYMVSTTNQKQESEGKYSDIIGTMFNYTGYNNQFRLNFIEHTFQGDWTRPLAKNHTLDLGAKYVLRRNRSKNNNEYIGWETQYTDFRHITDIAAAYAQYSVSIKHVTLRAGLRYEFSKLKADYPDDSQDSFSSNLSDWVPSAAASWQIDDANSLTANYATRISRPGISYLNPATKYTPTTESVGNPDLESAHAQSIKLTYMLIRPKFNLNFWTQYSFTDNDIAGYTVLRGNTLFSSYDNIGKNKSLSIGLFAQWSPFTKTSFMISANTYYDDVRQVDLQYDGWGANVFARIRQQLPLNLEAEIWGNYGKNSPYSPYTRTISTFSSSFWYGLSITGNYLKNRALNVSLRFVNPFGQHTMRYVTEAIQGPYTGTSTSTIDNRMQISVSVGYRFGNLNASVKKTRARIENDDLKGRKN